jgi:hypothetical protein
MMNHFIPALVMLMLLSGIARAQDNYEIQVYGSTTQDKGSTIFELHSNFTISGERNMIDGVRPSYHALHETLEITRGFGENFEVGFYIFTNTTSPYGFAYVGSHIRPRVSVPAKWHWPFGASLSVELGYQRRAYSTDTWTAEIRPILDRQLGNFYVSFNPTFGVALEAGTDHTPSFEPNLKLSNTFHKVALGVEYYGNLGLLNSMPALPEQSHALFAVADVYLDPKWELNFGPGWGLTRATDPFVFKAYVGRRINMKRKK